MSNVIAAFGPFRVIDGECDDVIFVDSANATAHVLDKDGLTDFAAELLDALDPEAGYGVELDCGGAVTTIHTPSGAHVFGSEEVARMMEAVIETGGYDGHPDEAPVSCVATPFAPGGTLCVAPAVRPPSRPDYIATPWGLYAVAA